MKNIVFSKFKHEEDILRQRVLFKECFPTATDFQNSLELYNWKFHTNYNDRHSLEYIASLENQIIGYYAALPYKYQIQEEIKWSGMVCDVMTGVQSRGKGVFTKLGLYSTEDIKEKNYDFTTGFPIKPEVIPGHLKIGWKIVNKLPLYFSPVSVHFLKNKIGFLVYPINFFLKYINIISSLFCHLFTESKITIEEIFIPNLEDVEGLEEFYQEIRKKEKISLVKDLSFLKWRLSAPGAKYKVFASRLSGKLTGLIIARNFYRGKINCYGIIEIATIKHNKNHQLQLISILKKHARLDKVDLIVTMMSNLYYKKYKLYLMLYFTSFKYFTFIIKNFTINDSLLNEKKLWNPMWINSDDL